MPLEGLILSYLSLYDDDTVLKAALIYVNDLPCSNTFSLGAELHVWRCQWKDNSHRPDTIINTLPRCTNLSPNIQTLLRLLAALPITSAIAERTFSTLKRLKSYLKSTANEERLNGPAIANINKKKEEFYWRQNFTKVLEQLTKAYANGRPECWIK